MSNTRTPAELKAALDSIVEELKAIGPATIPAAELVPFIKSVQSVGMYAAAIDAEIQLRALANGELLPGVTVKDAIKHRQWNDPATAEALAQETFGDAAFSRTLKSPAQIEKLPRGDTFVAVASFKPEAGKRVVY